MGFLTNKKHHRTFIVALIVVALTIGLTAFYSNCANPENSLSLLNSGTGFPTDSLVWRPNRIASFSCGPDGLQNNPPTQYAYPSFWLWYVPESFPGDQYPAGMFLSLDTQTYLTNNPHLSLGVISQNILDMQPAFELIDGAADSKPDGTGWYPIANADTAQLDIDYNFHTATATSDGQSYQGYQNNLVLAEQQVVSIDDMRTTTTSYPPGSGLTFFSLGLLFHTAAQSDPSSNLTYSLSLATGATETHVAGEALEFYVNGRAFEKPANSEPVLPFNANGLDRAQQSTVGARTHSWQCERYMVTVPGDQNCLCASGNCAPQDLGDISKITAIGTFGSFNSIPCFVPKAGYGAGQTCYSTNPPYNPIQQVNNAPAGQKPVWYENPPGQLNPQPWHSADSQSPHWLSICSRSTY